MSMKEDEQLRAKIANHPFKTMREAANPEGAKVLWYLGEEGADEIMQLITERDAAIRKTERRKGIRDGYSYALTEIDIANDYVDAWKRVSAAHKKAVERCHD